MVENTRRIVKCASKVIALVHIPVGVLLLVFGIVERVHVHPRYFDFTGQMGIGIWCGAWTCITGVLGILANIKGRSRPCRNALAGTFIGFAMASTVLGAVVFSFYMILSLLAPPEAICTGILVLGMFEFVIGIAGSMSGCLICDCCAHSSGKTSSVMYITGQGVILGDNAIGRGCGGVPLVFPVQQTGGVVSIPGGDAQMASMPPQDSQEPDLLLVPLEMPAMPSQSVVEETGQPPPYDGDTHSSSQDPDLLLVPLEVTAMPPQSVVQETGPPPPYDQISSCSTVGPSSGAEGDQPPQYSVLTYL
ncbi:uncharacterized protein [Porites lutea]|uniref:uncharacterized protein isoform X1 n=1 Tax=Porites lutea TaxID=51062 RepID=UPI003CC66AA5